MSYKLGPKWKDALADILPERRIRALERSGDPLSLILNGAVGMKKPAMVDQGILCEASPEHQNLALWPDWRERLLERSFLDESVRDVVLGLPNPTAFLIDWCDEKQVEELIRSRVFYEKRGGRPLFMYAAVVDDPSVKEEVQVCYAYSIQEAIVELGSEFYCLCLYRGTFTVYQFRLDQEPPRTHEQFHRLRDAKTFCGEDVGILPEWSRLHIEDQNRW